MTNGSTRLITDPWFVLETLNETGEDFGCHLLVGEDFVVVFTDSAKDPRKSLSDLD